MAQIQSISPPTTTIGSSLVSTAEVPVPTLLTLPQELRSAILRHVFPARPIQFFMNFSPNQDPPSAIHHPFDHLGILTTNHQLRNEALSILRSAISSTTLILNGLFPRPPPDYTLDENHRWVPEQERLNQIHLHFLRLLNLFVTQYAPDIHDLEVVNIPTPRDEVDVTLFPNLQHITFAQYIFPFSPFPQMFPFGLADAPTRIVIRWNQLRKIGFTTEMQFTPCPSPEYFEILINYGREIATAKDTIKAGFDVLIVVRILMHNSPDLEWLSSYSTAGKYWLEVVVNPTTFQVIDEAPLKKLADDGLRSWKGSPYRGSSEQERAAAKKAFVAAWPPPPPPQPIALSLS